MKKYFLISVATLVTLPALMACGGPTGDPEKDAEAFEAIFEKQCELEFEVKEKRADYLKLYSRERSYKTYLEFDSLVINVANEYKDYQERIADLNYKISNVEEQLNVKESSLY